MVFVGVEGAARCGFDAEHGKISGDELAVNRNEPPLLQLTVWGSPSNAAKPECAVVVAKVGVARIAERKIAVDAGGLWIALHNLDDVGGVRDPRREKKQRIDEGEDGRIGADAESEREDDGERKAGRLSELAESVFQVRTDRLQCGPLPDFPAALFEQRCVSEGATCGLFGCLGLMPSRRNCSVFSSRCWRISSARSLYRLWRRKRCGSQFIGEASQVADGSSGVSTRVMPSNMRSKLEICCSRWRRPATVIS